LGVEKQKQLMQIVLFTILFYIILGGVGMYFGSRKVDRSVARQRWIKYVVYILITSAVVISIWFRFFFVVAILIVLFGYYELWRTSKTTKQSAIALIVYSVMAAGFIVYALEFEMKLQFFIYFQVLALDAFSQVTGQLIGKIKIAPKISPTKTLEGLLGGTFFCVLSCLLTANWLGISLPVALVFGLFTALCGFTGDMLASFYKRKAGIKDYSKLLPGQGGFLDRFDSFITTGFFYSVLFFIFPDFLPS
jgi:phosphatidate cytidylyltransferase